MVGDGVRITGGLLLGTPGGSDGLQLFGIQMDMFFDMDHTSSQDVVGANGRSIVKIRSMTSGSSGTEVDHGGDEEKETGGTGWAAMQSLGQPQRDTCGRLSHTIQVPALDATTVGDKDSGIRSTETNADKKDRQAQSTTGKTRRSLGQSSTVIQLARNNGNTNGHGNIRI